jgi:hypothetical protein
VKIFERRGARVALSQAKIIKIAVLNLGIAIVNTVLFSPGFLGISIGGASIFTTAFGITVIIMSVVLFLYGNYRLLMAEEEIIQPSEIKTTEDYINALKQNYDKKTFAQDIDLILEQMERLQKKQETIRDILLQKFDSAEMSYQKFEGSIRAVEDIFYLNIKSILNKLNAFDEDEYNRIKKNEAYRTFSKEFIQTKMDIYQEYISFVQKSMEDNEQIILKLDKLLLEISKLNSLEYDQIEKMSGMKELDELIHQTKYYKS